MIWPEVSHNTARTGPEPVRIDSCSRAEHVQAKQSIKSDPLFPLRLRHFRNGLAGARHLDCEIRFALLLPDLELLSQRKTASCRDEVLLWTKVRSPGKSSKTHNDAVNLKTNRHGPEHCLARAKSHGTSWGTLSQRHNAEKVTPRGTVRFGWLFERLIPQRIPYFCSKTLISFPNASISKKVVGHLSLLLRRGGKWGRFTNAFDRMARTLYLMSRLSVERRVLAGWPGHGMA